MPGTRQPRAKRPAPARSGAVLLAGAVALLALPSAVLAFSSRFDPAPEANARRDSGGEFVPAEVDPRLSRSIAVRALGKGPLFRFTPAATPSHLDHQVTVAVRVDPGFARTITVQGALARADTSAKVPAFAPLGYSLGAARGYQSFAQRGAGTAALAESEANDLPDLAAYAPSPGAPDDPSRFNTRIALEGRSKTGRSPRTFEAQADPSVDLGGSYRVSRNLDVTAGIRYSTQHDRLLPLTDKRNDSQAVYVGTQFKF